MPETNSHKVAKNGWNPSSWKQKLVAQQPTYKDQRKLAQVVEDLSKLPPLVTSWEIETLKSLLAEAALGKQFLLFGTWKIGNDGFEGIID